MKKELKIILFPLISYLVLPLILSIFNILNINILSITYLILSLVIMFLTGLLVGFNTKEKGYLKGLLVGISAVTIMYILSYITHSDHSFYLIIYYLILIFATTLGSMIGCAKNKG